MSVFTFLAQTKASSLPSLAGGWVFLHRDNDFYTVHKRVLRHPPCHVPRQWCVVTIPGTAG